MEDYNNYRDANTPEEAQQVNHQQQRRGFREVNTTIGAQVWCQAIQPAAAS